jgi:hypothetical protein
MSLLYYNYTVIAIEIEYSYTYMQVSLKCLAKLTLSLRGT